MEEKKTVPSNAPTLSPTPSGGPTDRGRPEPPSVKRPNTIVERMRRVDQDAAKRYRQQTDQ